MKTRIAIGVVLVCILGLAGYLMDPVHRIQVSGLVRNEAFYRGMPLHYWLDTLDSENGNQRYEAILALAHAPEAIPGLTGRLKDPVPLLRHLAAVELGQFGSQARSATPALTEMLKDDVRE